MRTILGDTSRHAVILAVLCSALWFPGCSDDNPAVPATVDPMPIAIAPQFAWEKVQWSLNNHDSKGWTESVGLDFQYTPDPASEERYPGAFDAWGREAELGFVHNLFAGEVAFRAQMAPSDFKPPNPSSSIASWDSVEYWVRVEGVGGTSPVEYRGVAALEFRLEGNFWYLHRWVDLHGGTAEWNPAVVLPTLGELRAVYRME